jgi:outer membrane lipoprotein-sorting protein
MRLSLRGWIIAAAMALVAVGVSPAVSAQTIDELLAMNLRSRGGLDTLKGVSTIKMVGTVSGGGQQMTLTTWMKRPNLVKQEMSGKGQTIVQAFDGVHAWMVNPMMGQLVPAELPPAQADQLKNNADFDGPLVDYKAKGHTIELIGPDRLDGSKVYTLKVTKKGGQSQLVYLDAASGLERKMTAQIDQQGGKTITVDQVMSNYKVVSGLTVPFSIQTIVNGQLAMQVTVDTVEINTPIDDSVFRIKQ